MKAIESAHEVLNNAVIYFRGRPVGTLAANDPEAPPAAANYAECFVRDFVVSALVFLAEKRYDIVRNFLEVVLQLRKQQRAMAGHEIEPGVMPASFRVVAQEDGTEELVADFGERAIGRVAPVDSMMWWMILLGAYVRATGDEELAEGKEFQRTMHLILDLCLKDSFEVFPTVLVPDGAFMIDRRMGVYGHPLELQALFYGVLQTAQELLRPVPKSVEVVKLALKRQQALRTYVRIFYWLDLPRLNEIHRYGTEEFGTGSVNMLNIYPESIPAWVVDWLPENAGYLVGNLGPGRMDFRFFAYGNLLSILFGLATDEQAGAIMDLYEHRWSDLVGWMPAKICYPALEGMEWHLITGADPKNVPWSYHNGGNWPMLVWALVAAALKTGRHKLAQRAMDTAKERLLRDQWPEYYDGRAGHLIGRRANLHQVWSAAGLVFGHKLMEDRHWLSLLPT